MTSERPSFDQGAASAIDECLRTGTQASPPRPTINTKS